MIAMKSISASTAGSNLERLVDETAASHQPILIIGNHGNAVLLSEEEWRGVIETLYLHSFPGVKESIHQGLATPVEECSDEPGW
jgi:antitoxin YefM